MLLVERRLMTVIFNSNSWQWHKQALLMYLLLWDEHYKWFFLVDESLLNFDFQWTACWLTSSCHRIFDEYTYWTFYEMIIACMSISLEWKCVDTLKCNGFLVIVRLLGFCLRTRNLQRISRLAAIGFNSSKMDSNLIGLFFFSTISKDDTWTSHIIGYETLAWRNASWLVDTCFSITIYNKSDSADRVLVMGSKSARTLNNYLEYCFQNQTNLIYRQITLPQYLIRGWSDWRNNAYSSVSIMS
jgi:hypothetical protein